MMFKKIVSLFLIFIVLINPVFSQPLENKKDVNIEQIFSPIFDTEDVNGYKVKYILYPMDNLPTIPSGFFTFPYLDDLYCLKGIQYGEVITKLSMKQKDINRVVESERTNCKIELDRQKTQYEEREKAFLKKIESLESTNKNWDKKYKSLESKNFWTQVIAGAAVLTISGFSIYYVHK